MSAEIWVLVFHVLVGTGQTFEGGQYQTREKCELAGRIQFDHWRRHYRHAVTWRCHLLQDD